MSSMFEYTKNELIRLQALTPKLNDITKSVVDAISYPTVHPRMKATIAINHIMQFASQFRRSIQLWDDTLVPINSIGFIICGSGSGKDSSHRAAKRCFSSGYNIIQTTLEKEAKKKAIARATEAEEELPEEFECYKKYLTPVPPVETTVTTSQGLIKLVNDIGDHNFGSISLYSGEFADELAYNQDMTDNIKVLSELYDLGHKEVTYTKGAEFRSKLIDGQAVSALFIGSPTYLLYDENTKRKFQIAFMSKLARRSWFCYVPEVIPEPDFSSQTDPIKAMVAFNRTLEDQAKQARAMMDNTVKNVTNYHLGNVAPLKVTEEVFALFETYKRYNSELVETFPNKESTSALVRKHLQWKALKLAGAFAIFDCAELVTLKHYIQAIQFSELLSSDTALFEQELNKSYYERFADYIRTLVTTEGKASISIHDIKKQGFLHTTTKIKLQEMLSLVAGYDTSGIYSIVGEGTAIEYKPIIKTDIINVCYKAIDTSEVDKAIKTKDKEAISLAKRRIGATVTSGFDCAEVTFADLPQLLSDSFAYTPFKFKDGIRGKDNIIGGTKWLCFDVDNTSLSVDEMSFLLSDINHHINLSSDPSNEYKYKILIELDSIVTLDALTWKYFIKEVSEYLVVNIDVLPQSQIYYSYKGRKLISNLDAAPLEVYPFINSAIAKASAKEVSSTITTKQAALFLADPENTFNYAFHAQNGEGSRSLIRAAYHAKDLGASKEDVLYLLENINDYWEYPIEPSRFNSILAQVSRMF